MQNEASVGINKAMCATLRQIHMQQSGTGLYLTQAHDCNQQDFEYNQQGDGDNQKTDRIYNQVHSDHPIFMYSTSPFTV